MTRVGLDIGFTTGGNPQTSWDRGWQDSPEHLVHCHAGSGRASLTVARAHADTGDSVMSTGGMRRLDNPGRIREAVGEANDQFKNAISYRAVPCLLMIFQDGLDVPDDAIIKSALYGNLKYEFPKSSPDKGRLILDQDGAWNSTKNRTTSAVMYVRNSGEPLIVHNYSADRPLPAGLFLVGKSRCCKTAALRR